MSTLEIKQYRVEDKARWNTFVDQCDNADFFHRAEWAELLESSFGHRAHYLYVENPQNEIVALLPLARVKSRLFGDYLVSTPFCVYGGPAYTDQDAANQLVSYAADLGKALGVDYLELRSENTHTEGGMVKDLYSTFRLPLTPDRDAIMQAIWRKQRTVIRKSFKQGLTHTFDTAIDDFFHVYSTSVRNLGTPVFSKRYFKMLKETFGEQCEIMTIRKDGKPVSSVMSFYNKGIVYPYYGGGIVEARDLKSNDYMYYELMCHAAQERNCHLFDFGRSKKGTGAWEYKKHWAMDPIDLQYQYFLINTESLPDLSPKNPKYQLMIKVWKELPLPMSQYLGPYVSKYLG